MCPRTAVASNFLRRVNTHRTLRCVSDVETFCLFWYLTNSSHQQNYSLAFPTVIAYGMEDGQGKQFEKQTPTVFDRRTWLWNTTEAKLSILPVEFKLSKHISLSINRACVKQLTIGQAHNCDFLLHIKNAARAHYCYPTTTSTPIGGLLVHAFSPKLDLEYIHTNTTWAPIHQIFGLSVYQKARCFEWLHFGHTYNRKKSLTWNTVE